MSDDADRRDRPEPPEPPEAPEPTEPSAPPEPSEPPDPPEPPEPPDRPAPEDEAALAGLLERETAYGLFQRGHALMRRRHHAQAAILLERASRIEPGKGSIVEALARAYYNSGQHERAITTFQELIAIDPSAHYGHYGLGQSLKRVGRVAEARTHLRLACALAPQSTLYRAALERLG